MPLDERGRVCLDPGDTVVFHVKEWKLARVNVAPRGAPRPIYQNALVLTLDEVDGAAGEFEYRVTSEKLARAIKPLLDSGAFADRSVVVHAEGRGRLRDLAYHTMPRGVSAPPPTPVLPAWATEQVAPGIWRDRTTGRLRSLLGRFVALPTSAA